MLIYFDDSNDNLIATLEGELDHHTAEEVRSKLDDKIDRGNYKNLIMDFRNVNFMDSSGIGVVIGRYKKLERVKGRVIITSVGENIKRIFDLSALFKIVGLTKNVDEALKELE